MLKACGEISPKQNFCLFKKGHHLQFLLILVEKVVHFVDLAIIQLVVVKMLHDTINVVIHVIGLKLHISTFSSRKIQVERKTPFYSLSNFAVSDIIGS